MFVTHEHKYIMHHRNCHIIPTFIITSYFKVVENLSLFVHQLIHHPALLLVQVFSKYLPAGGSQNVFSEGKGFVLVSSGHFPFPLYVCSFGVQ